MLFRTFGSQEERRHFGGSDFIELQYCRLEQGSEIERIVSVDSIEHWKNDSLYLSGDEIDEFLSQYGEIFRGGIYNNGQTGVVDVFGINYYPRAQSWRILEQVEKKRPPDYQILMQWLQKVKHYIGFYILGE